MNKGSDKRPSAPHHRLDDGDDDEASGRPQRGELRQSWQKEQQEKRNSIESVSSSSDERPKGRGSYYYFRKSSKGRIERPQPPTRRGSNNQEGGSVVTQESSICEVDYKEAASAKIDNSSYDVVRQDSDRRKNSKRSFFKKMSQDSIIEDEAFEEGVSAKISTLNIYDFPGKKKITNAQMQDETKGQGSVVEEDFKEGASANISFPNQHSLGGDKLSISQEGKTEISDRAFEEEANANISSPYHSEMQTGVLRLNEKDHSPSLRTSGFSRLMSQESVVVEEEFEESPTLETYVSKLQRERSIRVSSIAVGGVTRQEPDNICVQRPNDVLAAENSDEEIALRNRYAPLESFNCGSNEYPQETIICASEQMHNSTNAVVHEMIDEPLDSYVSAVHVNFEDRTNVEQESQPHSTSTTNQNESDEASGMSPGAFSAHGRAEGETPAWVQQQRNLRYSAPPVSRRTLFNQQNASIPPEMRSLPLTPSSCISQHALSRRLSSFFVRNNVITAEVKVAEPKKSNKTKWIMLIVCLVVFIAIAIGLGIGLQGSNNIDEKNHQSDVHKECEYADVGEISMAWKRCLCQENSSHDIEAYVSQYESIETRLIDEIGLDLRNASSCETTSIALRWLAEAMVVNNTLYEDGRLTTRFSLSTFFLSLYNPNEPWEDKDSWMTSEHECKWFGVDCNEKDEVTSISLRKNKLSGSIPKELTSLNQLSRIDFEENAITGTIPKEFGRLKQMVSLDMQNNQIEGSIPDEIGQLTQLKLLRVSFNQLTGSIPTHIGNCSELKKLLLYNNALSNILPTEIGKLEKLEILSLAWNEEGMGGTVPSELGSCRSLQEIHFDKTKLIGTIPSEVGNLSNLEIFTASSNELTGSLPSTMSRLSLLKILNIVNNKLSGDIFTALKSTLLEGVFFSYNMMSGTIPTEVGLLSNLITLQASDNNLKGTIPTELGLLSNLEQIEISQNQHLKGVVPFELGSLSKLEIFHLYGTSLGGTIPDEICTLSDLESFEADCYNKIVCDCCTLCYFT